jgi:hypothetical protein
MSDYVITYRSVGAGLQTWDCTALCKYDAIQQFLEYTGKYQGNCYAKDSIVSVVKADTANGCHQ